MRQLCTLMLVLGLLLAFGGTAQAAVVLGTGTGALLGGDLTDPENDGDPQADVNYNWVGITSTNEPGFGGGEFSYNIFDNQVGGGAAKWCCDGVGGDGHQVTVEFDTAYVLTHFTATSSNDTPGRDPSVWEIQGSNDGVSFDTIFSMDNPTAAVWNGARNQVVLFEAGSDYPMPSESYRFLRYDVQNTEMGGGAHALSELEFFGIPFVTKNMTWTGGAAGDWGTANWSGPGMPPPDYPMAMYPAPPNEEFAIAAVIDTAGAVVTVEANHSAAALTLTGAQLTIGAGNTLTVTNGVAADTGTIAFGAGAQLVAGSGSITAVTTNGSNTLDIGGNMSVANWTDGAAGTFTKAGNGMLSLDNSGDTIDLDNTTLKISGGGLAFRDGPDPLGGAAQPVQLDGGMFSIRGALDTVEGVVNYGLYNGANNNANLTDIDDGAVNGQNGGLFALTPNETSAWGGDIYQGDLGSNYSVMWNGIFRPAATGDYEFWTHGDDFEVLLIDLNQNGEFDGEAEHVTWNVQPEGWNVPKTSALIPMTAGQDYEFAFVGWEIGGGAWAEMSITAPGGSRVRVNPGAETGGQWFGTGNMAINQPSIDFTVTNDSTINARTDQTATFGSLRLENGVVATTGARGGMSFTGTTIAPTATRVGIAPESTTDYGNALSGHAGLTLVLGGSADKPLAAAYTDPGDLALANMTNATIEVAGGTTSLHNKSLLAGSTNVILSGGTMQLAAPVAVPGADPGPVTAGMAIRFDASNGVTTNEDEVALWEDTAPGADGTYNASVDWASPVWVDNAFNGNAVMRFDGTNQQRLSFTE
ncbi:MAG: hypothetical protein HQ567_02510, partial [Candidatus Nealsonbacteria bacterium]|nr:hypothetical protein [Candidatus Nealsonbacteria bacterium]